MQHNSINSVGSDLNIEKNRLARILEYLGARAKVHREQRRRKDVLEAVRREFRQRVQRQKAQALLVDRNANYSLKGYDFWNSKGSKVGIFLRQKPFKTRPFLED